MYADSPAQVSAFSNIFLQQKCSIINNIIFVLFFFLENIYILLRKYSEVGYMINSERTARRVQKLWALRRFYTYFC